MKPSWILKWARAGGETVTEGTIPLSLEERMSRIGQALRQRFAEKLPNGELGYGVYPEQTYDDRVCFRADGKLWTISYEFVEGGEVMLGDDRTEVVMRPTPVTAREALEALDDERDGDRLRVVAQLLGPRVLEGEGAGTVGREWDVVLIQEGMSKNRTRYGRKCLAEAVKLYEGRPQFIDHDTDPGPHGRSGLGVVGFTRDVRGVILSAAPREATGVVGESKFAIAARACIVDEAFGRKLAAAHALGNPNLFGLSHDSRASMNVAQDNDGPFYEVTQIRKVESTDWVLAPAAGGRVMRLVASEHTDPRLEEDARMLKALLEALKAAGVTVPENCDETTATRLLQEALNRNTEQAAAAAREAARTTEQTAPTAPGSTRQITEAEFAALRTQLESQNALLTEGTRAVAALTLDRSLLECSLPEVFKTRIRKRFTAQIEAGQFPSADAIQTAIRESIEDVGALVEARVVMPGVGVPRAQIVKDTRQQVEAQLDEFWDPSKPMQSFRECYIAITGDAKVSGKLTEDVRRRLTESMTTASFDQILGDSITRRMLKDYAESPLANWRNTIAEVVPLSDFRTVRRLRFGGYGNLETVAQSAPYLAMTSPTDEEATYSPSKRGGTEQITLEMIKNDDVGAIRRIPSKLARAAAQTLHEFVWDFLANNSTIYDSVALAASGHTNIVTTALSAANISSLRLKIKQQADMSNGKRLGLVARKLIVPGELEESAFQLTTSDKVLASGNNDPNFVKKLGLEVIVVEYWTDTNNYWVTASVDQSPMIEIGFLDGQESPELFVQDLPNVGSMFSNDALTWKIRHTYGGAVMDYRPFAAGIVP